MTIKKSIRMISSLLMILTISVLSIAVFASAISEITGIRTEPAYPNLDQLIKIYADIPNPDAIDYVTLYYKINDSRVKDEEFSGPYVDDYAYISNPSPGDNILVQYYINATYNDLSSLQSGWQNFRYDGSAPSTSIIFKGPQYNWFVISDSKIELSCNDTISGCKEIIYYINGEEKIVVGDKAEFSLTGEDGENEIRYYSTDRAGNKEVEETQDLILDNTAPSVEDDYAHKNQWINEEKTVTITAEDSGSGIKEITYCIDGSCTTVNDDETQFKLEDPAIMEIKYWAIDNLGQKSEEKEFIAKIDLVAPGVWDNTPDIWQNAPFDITFTDTTSASLSPVTIYYKLWKVGEDMPIDYLTTTDKISILEDGEYNLKYYARDDAGNVEPEKDGRSTAKLDTTKPTITDDYLLNGIWTNQDARITFTASDLLSGLKEVRYCAGIACVPTVTSVLYYIFIGNTNDVLRYEAEDNAGNTADVQEIKVMIDHIIPITTDDAPSWWQNKDFIINLTASDDGLSSVKTYYKIDGNSWIEGNTIPITQIGKYDVYYYSQDDAGNKEDEKTILVRLDKTAPRAYIEGMPEAWQKVPATISARCDDETGGSGCNSYYNRLFISDDEITSCPQNYSKYNSTYIKSPQIITSHSWVCSAAVDNAINIGFSNPVEILVDSEMPEVEITSPSDNSILIGNTEIFAAASDVLSGIASVEYKLTNGITVVKTGVLAYNGEKYTAMITDAMKDIPAGTYDLIVIAKDNVGNEKEDKITLTAAQYILPKITSIVSSAEYGTNSTLQYSIFFSVRNATKIRMKMSDLTSGITSYTSEQLNARLVYNGKEYPVRNGYAGEWIELEETTAGAEGTVIFMLDIKDYMIPGNYQVDYKFEAN